MAKVIAFLLLLIVSPAAYAATTFTVGDTSGWTTGFNYDTWAASKTFTAGDTLLFNYGPSHTVDEVTQADYLSCNTANPISSDSGSPTSISLPAAGMRYFICVTSNHCSRGQKLAVTVTAGGAAPSPPTGTPSTPATPGTPTTPATPATPTTPATPGTPVTPRTPSTPAPPPPSGGAAAALGGRSGLVGGLSLVLLAVFGLMG